MFSLKELNMKFHDHYEIKLNTSVFGVISSSHLMMFVRWTYPDFFSRYRVLMTKKDMTIGDKKQVCKNLLETLIKVRLPLLKSQMLVVCTMLSSWYCGNTMFVWTFSIFEVPCSLIPWYLIPFLYHVIALLLFK